jgi:anionic cell wall polymer biosynthesis LytR-Cps2A-Psr (LCP) family protein
MQKWWWVGLVGVVFWATVAATAWWWPVEEGRKRVDSTNETTQAAVLATTEEVEEEQIDPLRPVWVLLLGYGGGSHAGGGLADTIIAAKVVPRQQQVYLYSLPRDLWVKMPFSAREGSDEEWWNKLNSTLAIGNSQRQYTWRDEIYQGANGGGNLAKKVVGEILGVTIDYYVAVDFAGFVRVIETIAGSDGLRVQVPYSFVDEWYPLEGEENNTCDKSEEEVVALTATMSGEELEQQFACRYERLEFSAGWQNIPAAQLLKLVRSRHGGVGGGDFGRSQRQEVVLEAVKDKLLSITMLPKVPALMGQLGQMVKTDVDWDWLRRAVFDYPDVEDFEMTSVVIGSTKLLQASRSAGGAYILQPRAGVGEYREIQELVASGSAREQ